MYPNIQVPGFPLRVTRNSRSTGPAAQSRSFSAGIFGFAEQIAEFYGFHGFDIEEEKINYNGERRIFLPFFILFI